MAPFTECRRIPGYFSGACVEISDDDDDQPDQNPAPDHRYDAGRQRLLAQGGREDPIVL
ncbi:hypothetical protein BP5796_00891 [Coleophoma crateriformis]|uniref:Uncharacterized protein n=1 Tax=Coleophoma crateriformis TaxID=565419 RepID=A0A3D8TBG4_9HELO|nr:hypothetical protein BP5796_00891 [Coleophoma crateriformis]